VNPNEDPPDIFGTSQSPPHPAAIGRRIKAMSQAIPCDGTICTDLVPSICVSGVSSACVVREEACCEPEHGLSVSHSRTDEVVVKGEHTLRGIYGRFSHDAP
jgi:hypothetical protein